LRIYGVESAHVLTLRNRRAFRIFTDIIDAWYTVACWKAC